MTKIDKVYERAHKEALEEIKKGNDIFKIAGAYMAIAMRLYRSSLSEEDFNKMKEAIMKIDVEPYQMKTLH